MQYGSSRNSTSTTLHATSFFMYPPSATFCNSVKQMPVFSQSNPTFKFNLQTEMWAVVCFMRYYVKCCNRVAMWNETFWVILRSVLYSVSGPLCLYPRHLCQLSRSLPYVYRLNLPLSHTSDQMSWIKQINYIKAHKMHLSNRPHSQGLFPGLGVGCPKPGR